MEDLEKNKKTVHKTKTSHKKDVGTEHDEKKPKTHHVRKQSVEFKNEMETEVMESVSSEKTSDKEPNFDKRETMVSVITLFVASGLLILFMLYRTAVVNFTTQTISKTGATSIPIVNVPIKAKVDCSQFNGVANYDKCVQAQKDGGGCVWQSDCQLCFDGNKYDGKTVCQKMKK